MIKKKILLFTDWYEPGYRAGGPIRSCVNFVQQMKHDYHISIFTSDRDLGEENAYPGIVTDRWIEAEETTRIYYASPANLNRHNIEDQMIVAEPDFVYLNGMFSKYFTIYPLLIWRQKKIAARFILSPRGMLKASAIRFKAVKKKPFLTIFRWFGYHQHLQFLASDETEVMDVQHHFGRSANVTRIPNFSGVLPGPPSVIEKRTGEVALIFVGRIHPIKNLLFLLSLLQDIRGKIRLTIIGSLEDESYWEKCSAVIKNLPAEISVTYLGEKPNHELPPIIAQHHIFVLPTKGENFGHAILEAMMLGKPVVISDQTPWKNLEKAGAGWDIPLDRPERFRQAIEDAALLDQQQYNQLAMETYKFAGQHTRDTGILGQYKTLFS